MCFRGSKGEASWIHRVEHGIEANPKKITAISNMGPIRNVKGIQRLTDCLAALSQFISRLGEWGMPLYKLLKKTNTFV